MIGWHQEKKGIKCLPFVKNTRVILLHCYYDSQIYEIDLIKRNPPISLSPEQDTILYFNCDYYYWSDFLLCDNKRSKTKLKNWFEVSHQI